MFARTVLVLGSLVLLSTAARAQCRLSSTDLNGSDEFGTSLSLSGGTLVVGAREGGHLDAVAEVAGNQRALDLDARRRNAGGEAGHDHAVEAPLRKGGGGAGGPDRGDFAPVPYVTASLHPDNSSASRAPASRLWGILTSTFSDYYDAG